MDGILEIDENGKCEPELVCILLKILYLYVYAYIFQVCMYTFTHEYQARKTQ